MTNEQISIEGIVYQIMGTRVFNHLGKSRESITLRRPAGRRAYNVIRYENGALSSVTPIPGCYL